MSPVFLVALGGLYLGSSLHWLGDAAAPLVLLLFGLAAVAYIARRYRISYTLLAAAVALIILGQHQRETERFRETQSQLVFFAEYRDLRGTLRDYPEIGNGFFILILDTDQILIEGTLHPYRARLRLRVQGRDPGLDRGDRIEIACRVQPLHQTSNFAADPMEQYYFSRRIHALANSKSADLINRLSRAPHFWRILGEWRRRIRTAIERVFLSNGSLSREGVFLEAIILGDRGRLEATTEETLIQAGALHLIAISGANIGMITWMVLALLTRIGCPRSVKLSLTAAILIFFLALSGFDVSASRAVLMVLFVFYARLCHREASPTIAISAAALLLLIGNPALFRDPGYVLTVGLTFAIFSGLTSFAHWFPSFPSFLRDFLVSCLTASAAALPLSLHFFHRFSWAGVSAGVILIPLSTIITGVGMLIIPLALVAPTAAAGLITLAKPVFAVFFGLTEWAAAVPGADFHRYLPTLLPAIGVLICLGILARVRPPSPIRLGVGGILFLLLLLAVIDLRPRGRTYGEAVFLDVGQGDSQIIRLPNGDGLLVDGGGGIMTDFSVGRRIVLPFLLREHIRVRWVAVTHLHADHVNGVIDLLSVLHPKEIWIGTIPRDSKEWERLSAAIPRKTRLVRIASGWLRTLPGGFQVRVLHPLLPETTEHVTNDQSLVMRVGAGQGDILLTGDSGAAVEARLVREYPQDLTSLVLKIAHHGSRSSTSLPFLQAVHPRWAVISAGHRNSFQLPHREVAERLRQEGVTVLRTDRHGAVRFRFIPGGFRPDFSANKYWPRPKNLSE